MSLAGILEKNTIIYFKDQHYIVFADLFIWEDGSTRAFWRGAERRYLQDAFGFSFIRFFEFFGRIALAASFKRLMHTCVFRAPGVFLYGFAFF